jgi:hypothetical protein
MSLFVWCLFSFICTHLDLMSPTRNCFVFVVFYGCGNIFWVKERDGERDKKREREEKGERERERERSQVEKNLNIVHLTLCYHLRPLEATKQSTTIFCVSVCIHSLSLSLSHTSRFRKIAMIIEQLK